MRTRVALRARKPLIGSNDSLCASLGFDGLAGHCAGASEEDRRENERQRGNDQHSLLKPERTKCFGHAGGASLKSGAMCQKIAEAPGKQRAEGRAAHVHGHEIDGHGRAALVWCYQVLNRGGDETVVAGEQRIGQRERQRGEKQRAPWLEYCKAREG